MPLHFTLDPVCVKPSLQYGFANCSPSDDNDTLVAVGGQCSIHCDMGYKLQNSNGTIHCLPNGSWSHQADCILIMCPSFEPSSVYVIYCNNGSLLNSVCSVSCLNGTAPTEDAQYICSSNSQWEPMGDELNCNQVTSVVASGISITKPTITLPVDHVTTLISNNSTTVPAFDGTVHTSNSKNSANGGAIAGGIIAAILLLIGLLTVAIILLWCCRKRLGGVLHLGTPSLSESISLPFLL